MVVSLLKYCLLVLVAVTLVGITPTATVFAGSNNGHGNGNNNNNGNNGNGNNTPNPGGNNGFIKVNDEELSDNTPNNDPHVACQFRIEFYNYDLGNTNATVQFEMQAPTNTVAHSLTVTTGDLNPFIGGDAAGGGNDLDANELYTLSFTGTPQTNQGYHVKLTVNAPGSNGNDVKHKTFWVEPCAVPEVAPQLSVASVCEKPGQSDGQVIVTVTNPNSDSITYTVTVGNQTKTVTVAGNDNATITFDSLNADGYVVTATHGNLSTQAQVVVDECAVPPQNPTVTARACSCVAPNAQSGKMTVQVTNPNAYTVTYQVTVNGVTKDITLDGGLSGEVTFTGLAAGSYTVAVVGNDDTSATTEATLITCEEEPTCPNLPNCEPGRGGDDTPPVVVPTTPTPTPPAAPAPAVLANTGMPLMTPLAFAIILLAFWATLYKRPKTITQSAA